jgi:hypothetical protein
VAIKALNRHGVYLNRLDLADQKGDQMRYRRIAAVGSADSAVATGLMPRAFRGTGYSDLFVLAIHKSIDEGLAGNW